MLAFCATVLASPLRFFPLRLGVTLGPLTSMRPPCRAPMLPMPGPLSRLDLTPCACVRVGWASTTLWSLRYVCECFRCPAPKEDPFVSWSSGDRSSHAAADFCCQATECYQAPGETVLGETVMAGSHASFAQDYYNTLSAHACATRISSTQAHTHAYCLAHLPELVCRQVQ